MTWRALSDDVASTNHQALPPNAKRPFFTGSGVGGGGAAFLPNRPFFTGVGAGGGGAASV